MVQQSKQLALLIDFENLFSSLDSESNITFIPELIATLESRFGKVAFRKAYADWSNAKLRKAATELQRNGVEMQHVVRGQNKNLTESLLALQAMYTVAVYPNLTGVVIVSGDGDYLALVNQLKTRGLSVIGVGADGNANSSWSRNCDEYLVCNAAAPAPAEKKSSNKAAAATIPASEKNQIISTLKELIPVNGILLPDLEDKLKENHPDFAPENYHFRDLSEFLQSLGNAFKIAETDEGIIVSSQAGRNASPYTLQELQSFTFEEYMQATRWYIVDGNIRDRVLHNIYALFEESGRVLTNEELHNLVDPDHIVEERPWYGTIFSLVYGACLWENPDDSSIPLPRRRLSLFRTVKSEEEFLIRYYTSLFHKAYTERPELTARMCAELMHPEDVEAHIPLYEQVLEELSHRH